MRSSRSRAALSVLVLALIFHGGTVCGQEATPAPAPPPEPAAYTGSEACAPCHEDLVKAFARNPHRFIETNKKYHRVGQSCESCHGTGGKHVETAATEEILNPVKLQAGRADRICLACHLNQQALIGRIRGGHADSQVACTACHAVHAAGPAARIARPSQVNAQCSACHRSAWAQFQRPHAHRLVQDAMSCADCHNPHGSIRQQPLRAFAGNESGCLKCHTDKRGPFTFEHAPVRLEGCGTCHEPHGSSNPHMLIRHEVRYVCLECHANTPAAASFSGSALGTVPPSFHDLRSERYRNCTICHQKVHGSHVDRWFLR